MPAMWLVVLFTETQTPAYQFERFGSFSTACDRAASLAAEFGRFAPDMCITVVEVAG